MRTIRKRERRQRRQRWLTAVMAVFLVAGPGVLPACAGPTGEVTSSAYAAPSHPANIGEPGSGFINDETEHDPDKGEVFDGAEHYDLRQGGKADDKKKWAATDYIHWKVHGATLRAEGQVTDTDSADATSVSSQAWGMLEKEGRVSRAKGEWGEIKAKNTIQFLWDWDISGSAIAEGRVKLRGLARDIHDVEHVFSLNAVVAEQATSEDSTTQTETTSKSSGNRSKVGSDGVESGGNSTSTTSKSEAHSVGISRRYARSDGDSGQTKPLVVTKVVTGKTTLAESFLVSSTGNVTLVARTATNGSTVTVSLKEFTVRNELQVWARAISKPDPEAPPPPPSDPGTPGGPTTPGGGPNPPAPDSGGDDPGGPETGGGHGPSEGASGDGSPDTVEPAPEPERPRPNRDDRRARSRTTWQLPGDGVHSTSVAASIVRPWGVQSDIGSLAGRVRLALAAPLARALTFQVSCEPAGRLNFGGRQQLVVRSGTTLAALHFHAVQAGSAQVILTPVGEAGGPVDLPVETSADDVAGATKPAVWAAFAGGSQAPGRGDFVEVVRGDPVPDLRVGRFAFSGISTAASEFVVETNDPFGLLVFPPESVSIPAGESQVVVPLQLNDVEGTAELTLRGAGQTLRITVRAVNDQWLAVRRIRVPVGAVVPIGFRFARDRVSDRAVSVEIGNTGLIDLQGDATKSIDRDATVGHFLVRAAAPGLTQAVLHAAGLPNRTVEIEVVDPDVSIAAGTLHLSRLDPTRGGLLRLDVAEGVTIASLGLPENAGDVLVEGVGSNTVTIRFEPDPNRPVRLDFPIRIEGLGPNGRVQVLDTLHNSPEDGILTYYQVSVE